MAQEPEYIYPPNQLKNKVTVDAGTVDMRALAEAEQAIADMKDDYLVWVKEDIARLQEAYEATAASKAERPRSLDDVYAIAHDVKGQGGSFGYPLMTAIGNQLCRFIERLKGAITPSHLEVIKVHIDAMHVVIAERLTDDGGKAGKRILAGLDAVIEKVAGED